MFVMPLEGAHTEEGVLPFTTNPSVTACRGAFPMIVALPSCYRALRAFILMPGLFSECFHSIVLQTSEFQLMTNELSNQKTCTETTG